MDSPTVDGSTVTFRWAGDGPPPVVIGSWCGWDVDRGMPMVRIGEAWQARIELPRGVYVEYGFVRGGVESTDPANPLTVDNGVGGRNSRLWMPGATRRAIALARRRVPRGRVETGWLDLGFFAAPPNRRRMATYLPAVAVDDAAIRSTLPLMVVLDGLDYLRRGRLDGLLDALIASGSMAPVAAVFVDDAGRGRSTEYAANDFTLASLADVVVPAAVTRLGLARQERAGAIGRAAILGSSLGGLMALHAGVRRPDVFGTVIAQSAAALLDPIPTALGEVPRVTLTVLDLIRATTVPPVRLWLDVGELEDLAPQDDRLADLLRARSADVRYRRFPGGHDQASWAESLVDALPAMFPVTS